MLKIWDLRLPASLLTCLAIGVAYPAVAVAQQDEEQQSQERDSEDREANDDEDSDRDESRAEDRSRDDRREERRSDRDQNWRDREVRSDRNTPVREEIRDDFPAPRYSGDEYSEQYRNRTSGQNDAALGVTIDPNDDGNGVLVDQVHRGSPAEQMGIREGDRIVRLNDQQVRSAQQFASRVRNMQPGEEIELEVERDDDQQSLFGRLESRREALVMRTRSSGERGQSRVNRDRYEESFSDSPSRGFSESRRTTIRSPRQQGDLVNRINSIQRQIDRLNDELDELRFALQERSGQQREAQVYREGDGETTASYQEYDSEGRIRYRDSGEQWNDRQPATRRSSWSDSPRSRGARDTAGTGVSGENRDDTAPNSRIQGESTPGGEIGGGRLRPGRN